MAAWYGGMPVLRHLCICIAATVVAVLGAAPTAHAKKDGTAGVMRAAVTAGVVPVRRVGIYDESRTGLGARLVAHIRKRLMRRGIRIDETAAVLLTLRPVIVNSRGGASPTDDPLSIAPSKQARISASPVWRHSEAMGISRIGKPPGDQLGGGRLSLHLRNKMHVLRNGGSMYRIQLQLERDGQAPLWHGIAMAVGRSIDAERALTQMVDKLLAHLGRPLRLQHFTTR
jgi:hypothetical protein